MIKGKILSLFLYFFLLHRWRVFLSDCPKFYDIKLLVNDDIKGGFN